MYDDEVVQRNIGESILTYIDFSNWLNSGAIISDVNSITTSGDQTISDITSDETKVYFTISGGSISGTHTITANITTSDSEILIAKVKLRNR